MELRETADLIIKAAIRSALPDEAMRRALAQWEPKGRVCLVAIGKAAWQMANAAYALLEDKISQGIVITKHGYSMGAIGALRIREAGHPVPDADSYSATQEALEMVQGLTASDTVLFLVSGGGSALFESPLIAQSELEEITSRLLGCGADITEMNIIRKRLSNVKGGRFALHCAPA